MFSFVPVVILVAIIARTQALECYVGVASGYPPVTLQQCPPASKYCYSLKPDCAPTRYGCGFDTCKEKGCRVLDYGIGTLCCCASDRCNRG